MVSPPSLRSRCSPPGPSHSSESAALFGIAALLWILPPSDGIFGRVEPDAAVLRHALLALRVGVATSLVTLAFSENFTNPELASRTLQKYPFLDVFSLVGIHLPHGTFIAFAASVELLFGLLVLSGALPQVVALVAATPFTATLLLFGTTELIGHLPNLPHLNEWTAMAVGLDPVIGPCGKAWVSGGLWLLRCWSCRFGRRCLGPDTPVRLLVGRR